MAATYVRGTQWSGNNLDEVDETLTIQGGPAGVGFYALHPRDPRGRVIVHDGNKKSQIDWTPGFIEIANGNGSTSETRGQQLQLEGEEHIQLIGPEYNNQRAMIIVFRGTINALEGNSANHERL